MNQKERARDQYLRRKFNISLKEYDLILAEQGGVCAGCERRPEAGKRSFAVDHLHDATKLIRGILCMHCNRMLPNRKGMIFIVENLLEYLKHPPATRALGGERSAKR
jgi:hypothetical protein